MSNRRAQPQEHTMSLSSVTSDCQTVSVGHACGCSFFSAMTEPEWHSLAGYWFRRTSGDVTVTVHRGVSVQPDDHRCPAHSPVTHLHGPISPRPVCGAPVPADRATLTAYRSETTCTACTATLAF